MTGENNTILKIFALTRQVELSNLSLAVRLCNDELTKHDVMQLLNLGIPANRLQSKNEVLRYIHDEVADAIPVIQDRRKTHKAFRQFKRALKREIGI